MSQPQVITVSTIVPLSKEKVWQYWTQPQHIMGWNNASDEWHTPNAENNLEVGGRFSYRMEAKDGSMGFDFSGKYTEVIPLEKISYVLDDDRKVDISFEETDGVNITEAFEAETINSPELQQQGWQAILDNFKRYALAQG